MLALKKRSRGLRVKARRADWRSFQFTFSKPHEVDRHGEKPLFFFAGVYSNLPDAESDHETVQGPHSEKLIAAMTWRT
jgi:hypothetical protein